MAYPKPDTKDWEVSYRYAHAKDEVYAKLLQTIQSWSLEAKEIVKQEEEPHKTIV